MNADRVTSLTSLDMLNCVNLNFCAQKLQISARKKNRSFLTPADWSTKTLYRKLSKIVKFVCGYAFPGRGGVGVRGVPGT